MVRPRKTYMKMLRRSVGGSLARFLSILGIVLIGTGFLAGLIATPGDMQLTAHNYYETHRVMDVNIKGTLGLTEEDAAVLAEQDKVSAVMPACVSDVIMSQQGGEDYVVRLYGVPLDWHGSTLINDFELAEGRMPEAPGECLIASTKSFTVWHELGEVYTLSTQNTDYGELGDTYALDTFTVVGLVKTPYYMSMESEPSTVGAGSVQIVMFAAPESYALDVYTDIFLTLDTGEVNSFTEEYLDEVEPVTASLETLGEERSKLRFTEVKNEAQEEIDSANEEYEEAKADAESELADARAKLDDADVALTDAEGELADARDKLENAEKKVNRAQRELNEQTDEQRAKLEAMRPMLGELEYAAMEAQIDTAYEQGRQQISSARRKLDSSQQELDDAEQELNDKKQELKDAEEEYRQAKEDADRELADARLKLDDAQTELDGLEEAEWYVFDRSDIVSYESYKSNTGKIEAIARVFPLFLFLVAALVALTTMTRMVEEDRLQIGTLKALGYSNLEILAYYLGYSISASLLGSIIGMLVGFKTLPVVISKAYDMMYTIPRITTVIRWEHAALIAAAAVACTTVAALAACLSALRERPAALMLPKAPQAGKRIFLERVGCIWKRLKFSGKVTARNIFRYKKRLYMTVIGIAGCTALLLTGFGLRDSIRDIVDIQFGELYTYNMATYIKSGDSWQEDAAISEFFNGSEYVDGYARLHTETAYVELGGKSETVSLYVPEKTEQLTQQIVLRERKSGADIPFGEDSVVLTEKLCETLNLSVGDSFTLRDEDDNRAEFTLSAIAENYVTNFMFISPTLYESSFDKAPECRLVLADINDESVQAENQISSRLLESENVMLVHFNSTIQESFENTIKNINYIIVVLIVSAGALAGIVLYNLTNINISERKKELATIKVLGFYEGEVARYIYRETTWLAIMGTIVGLGFGVWLHSFVVKTAEVDAVMFGRTISPISYLFAAAATMGFTGIIDLIMLPRIRNIDMVESMKANE